MPQTLKDLPVGTRARVVGLRPDAAGDRRKLMSMGVMPGVELTVARVAPLGDPVEIELRGFRLSLRKAEAAAVLTEPLV